MKHHLLQTRFQTALLKRYRLLALCAALSVVVVLQSMALFFKDDRIIIVPTDSKQSFWVQEGKVSASYLEEMAIFLADFCLSVSPASTAYQRSVVLKYAHPSKYGALKAQFIEMERFLKKQGVSTTFRPIKVSVFEKELSVDIWGDFMTWVGSKHLSTVRQVYRLTFSLEKGRLFLRTFEDKQKGEGA